MGLVKNVLWFHQQNRRDLTRLYKAAASLAESASLAMPNNMNPVAQGVLPVATSLYGSLLQPTHMFPGLDPLQT